jgi:adenine C2-methylase RlmN of 23S rRNA A2503 and tRNA A37
MTNESKKILSEISAGELLDKMSILEIKLEKIRNKNDKDVINKEYLMLKKTRNINIQLNKKTKQLIKEIKKINLVLWNIEDEIRNCEKEKNFGKKFVELARSVYLNNDKRAKIKSEINEIFGSNIKEIKLYADY